MSDKKTSSTADREIVITRTFDAPRELVWDAMTNPQHVVNWWGPRGFSTTIKTMDVKVGGVWEHIMHGPDGTDYPNYKVFKEVVKPERLVFSHGASKKDDAGFAEATWTFDEVAGNKTKLTLRMVFPTAEERERVVTQYKAIEGGKQTLARLAEFLEAQAAMATSESDFVITRVFDAPRELVWQAWTDPKHMAQWWGPKDFTNPVCQMDVRPGGAFRITMRGPDGSLVSLKGVYRELVAPERLVMVMDCSEHSEEWHDLVNPQRDKSKPPAMEIVTFEEIEGGTKLIIHSRFETPELRANALKVGMRQGWSQSLDRLADCVSKIS